VEHNFYVERSSRISTDEAQLAGKKIYCRINDWLKDNREM